MTKVTVSRGLDFNVSLYVLIITHMCKPRRKSRAQSNILGYSEVTKIVYTSITAEILEHRFETRQSDLHDQFEAFLIDSDQFRVILKIPILASSQRYDKALSEATFKCGKKSQIMRYRTCRKWRIVRSCAAEFFELCGKCAVDLIELCDYYAVNHRIVQKMCGR